jgi:hypothetical protein
MPMRDEMTPEMRYAIEHNVEFANTLILTTVGLPVDIARTKLLKRVLALSTEETPEFVAFIDFDAFWWNGTLTTLMRNVNSLCEITTVRLNPE